MELTEADIKRFWSKVDKRSNNECWNWTGCLYDKNARSGGYGGIRLNHSNERSHRVALWITKGPPPLDKPCALHSCKQNRLCCNPEHLRWGTHQENMIDRKNDGTTYAPTGEEHQNAKLTMEQAREIRRKYVPYKYSAPKLAMEYGVCRMTIERILNNTTYKEL